MSLRYLVLRTTPVPLSTFNFPFSILNLRGSRLVGRGYKQKAPTRLSQGFGRGRGPTLPLSQYHRRGEVYLLCSEWEEVEPSRYHHLNLFVLWFAITINV